MTPKGPAMIHHYPHMGSSSAVLAAIIAFGAGTINAVTDPFVAQPVAVVSAVDSSHVTVTADDLKWAASMGMSAIFGIVAIYIRVCEQIEKSRLSRAERQRESDIKLSAMKDAADREKQRLDFEERESQKRIAAWVQSEILKGQTERHEMVKKMTEIDVVSAKVDELKSASESRGEEFRANKQELEAKIEQLAATPIPVPVLKLEVKHVVAEPVNVQDKQDQW